MELLGNLYNKFTFNFIYRAIIRSGIFRLCIFIMCYIVWYVGLLGVDAINFIVVAALLMYYVYRVTMRSNTTPLLYAVVELGLILAFLFLFWYMVMLLLLPIITLDFGIGIVFSSSGDADLDAGSDESSQSSDSDVHDDSDDADPSNDNDHPTDDHSDHHTDDPGDNNNDDNHSNYSGSGDNGSSHEGREPSHHSNSPGMPDVNREHDFCLHRSLDPLPLNSGELCGFNPEIDNQGNFCHHPVQDGRDPGYTCGECGINGCFDCFNPPYPEGYSHSEGSPDRGQGATQWTVPDPHMNPESGPSNSSANAPESGPSNSSANANAPELQASFNSNSSSSSSSNSSPSPSPNSS